MEEEKRLEEAILKVSKDAWSLRNEPALLSDMPPLLTKAIPNYKAILGTRNLKAFIKSTGSNAGYKLVEHPTQRARVGVAPETANFEYAQDEAKPTVSPGARKANEEVVIAFLRALANLPNADLDKVVLPASVLAKLLK
ncbi:hypothetical protein [Burkholderia sp. ABCPW 111]|uniref:hypothetical protein n=1 Tax=Burkholderia sp. ABCPW 111 TaxID=1820025 RepID=UPI00053159A7|nr:hypothetical protein [Burkholderia sp. ABCPW 111]KGR93963.1 hypothetical protein X946_5534 [Burkholderia sp. ABCPW 111]